jgi:hypothetical protein
MRMRTIPALVAMFLSVSWASAEAPKVGDAVWAQWKPNQWYHGKIEKKTEWGFHIKFDDGDESDVAASQIAADTAPTKDAIKPGMRVIVPIQDSICQFATVVKVADDKVDCKLEDLSDTSIELKDVRVVHCVTRADVAPKAGDIVWAQWRPNAWFKGKVGKKIDLGLHVEFDDGDVADLPISLVVKDSAPTKDQVKAGKRVLSLFSDGKFYPGTVTSDGADGKYKIKYDDGDEGESGIDDLRLINE